MTAPRRRKLEDKCVFGRDTAALRRRLVLYRHQVAELLVRDGVRHVLRAGDENKKRTSAILNIEIWRGNKNAADLDLLKKGNRLTVKGFFKPEEYEKDGKTVQKIVFRGTEITTGDDEEEAPETTEEA
jgi:single-strand DNA-binding protein